MLRSLAGAVKNTPRNSLCTARWLSLGSPMQKALPTTEEFEIFPNESEGDVYADNWSLCDDGIYSQGKAYRNARLAILTKELGAKKGEPIKIEKLNYYGKFKLDEAGDSISQQDFTRIAEAQQDHLNSGADIFMEDASLGSYSKTRIGVRVVTLNPAVALIARTLLMPLPPRPCDHRSRFNGWNLDPRWQSTSVEWNGESYTTKHPEEQEPAAGQRPIAAIVGGPGAQVAVQFKGTEKIVGATIVIGSDAPIEALVSSVGHATTVMLNSEYEDSVAVPSVSFTGENGPALIVGADQSVLDAIVAGNKTTQLHGAYHNLVTPDGISALWNGVIGLPGSPLSAIKSDFGSLSSPVPTVIGNAGAALPVTPDNLIALPKQIAFYEKGASKSKLTLEQGVKKLGEMADASESKIAAISAMMKSVEFVTIGKAADATAL